MKQRSSVLKNEDVESRLKGFDNRLWVVERRNSGLSLVFGLVDVLALVGVGIFCLYAIKSLDNVTGEFERVAGLIGIMFMTAKLLSWVPWRKP